MKTILSLATALMLLAGCSDSGKPPQGNISKERSAAFKNMLIKLTEIEKVGNGERTYKADEFKAMVADFSAAAKKPFTLFQSDPNGNGRAIPLIWQDKEKFVAAEQDFYAAVDKLNTIAQSGSPEGIKAATEAIEATCKSCHQSFRE